MWVLGAIDRQTKNCFLVPCPGNKCGVGSWIRECRIGKGFVLYFYKTYLGLSATSEVFAM